MRAELWQERLKRWMARRGQILRPAAERGQPQPEAGPPPPPGARSGEPVGVEQLFARARGLTAERGAEPAGPHWRLRWEPECLPAGPELAGALGEALGRSDGAGLHEDFGPLCGARAEDLLFFDTETLGLGNSGVFLVGCMTLSDGGLAVEQLFAQDYSEEAAILRAFAGQAAGRGVLVSFNGRAFDMPLLSCRAGVWRVDLSAAEAMHHLDLLYECRRRWGGALPDCRLQTVEAALSGRCREGDLPGWQIPSVYHEFVARGDARPLGPILQHNMLDLVAMGAILAECLG